MPDFEAEKLGNSSIDSRLVSFCGLDFANDDSLCSDICKKFVSFAVCSGSDYSGGLVKWKRDLA